MRPNHRPAIERIAPYVPGKPVIEVKEELGLSDVTKLASNENPLGPSPLAVEALRKAIGDVHIYPDGAVRSLRSAIASKCGVRPDEVFVGNGSDEVIKLLAEAFLQPEDQVVFADVTFSEYAYATRLMGAQEVVVPLRDETHDLEAFSQAITPQTKLIYVCNPNNPTGTYVNATAVQCFLDTVPPGVLVVFDEAYFEYVDAPDFPDILQMVREGRMVATMRTFSKIYGLAGLRVGYVIAPSSVTEVLNRVKEPFSVNSLAQVAAEAALDDEDHLANSLAVNQQGKQHLYEAFTEMGLDYLATQSNFVFVDVGRPCRPVYDELLQAGIVVRTGDIFGRPNALRVSIGTPEQISKFLAVLRQTIRE